MARIPYADVTRPEVQTLSAQIAAGRGGVLHLYRTLLHSLPVAEDWLRYLAAIRHECALPGALRELVIMRVAHLNGAPYEAEQHAPIALEAGLTQAQLDRLGDWPASDVFDARQRAVLALPDAMTRDVHIPDAVFTAAAAQLDTRTLVEAVATVAAYNMVSRFLEAFQISSQDRA